MKSAAIAMAAMMAPADAGAGGCTSIPKIWLEDQRESGMPHLELMAELPSGCTGQYQIALTRQQGTNRNATRQSGPLPKDGEGPVVLSRITMNDAPGARILIEIEVSIDNGMVIRHSIERPAG